MNKALILIGFVLVAFVQAYVPAKMIMDREEILASGTEFKFEAAPVDPNDPFRGKYIILNFRDNRISVKEDTLWESGEAVYLILESDPAGFVKINRFSREEPDGDQDYLEVRVNYYHSGDRELFIDYPFDRYYLEESKAPRAEQVYAESLQDSSQLTYALVSIRAGEAVLKDVMINDISIGSYLKDSDQ